MRKPHAALFPAILMSLAMASSAVGQTPGEITTYAGIGYGGYSGDGGLATSAEISEPLAVAVDKSGNLFIADFDNYCIRKVAASTGIINTVAGTCSVNGFAGDGGPATSAKLSFPFGVAVDGADNIYISDPGNARIRKVTAATGIITTVAGDGLNGYSGDGGQATSAAMNGPGNVAVDPLGNLYIVDTYNSVIRKVTASTGIITTVAGGGTGNYPIGNGGPATAASLSGPQGLTVDKSGNLYILDQNGAVVRKVTASTGIITTIAGNDQWGFAGDGGPATSAELYDAQGLGVDGSGNLYIADTFNFRVRKVTAATGIITTIAGDGTESFSGDGGQATDAALRVPEGVTVNSSGVIYIGDTQNDRVRKVLPGGLAQSVTNITVPVWAQQFGSAVQLTAQVTGLANGPVPTGNVTFYVGTVALGSAELNSAGIATFFTNALPEGADWLSASYGGNSYYATSTSAASSVNIVSTVAAPPFFNPPAGTYESRLQVVIGDASPGVALIYTTDGSIPSLTNGIQSNGGAITVNATETIRAVAVGQQYAMGPVATTRYAIHLPYERPLPRGEWAWESGGDNVEAGSLSQCGFGPGSLGLPGVYGTLGVPAAKNVPGSRRHPESWTDKNGNFWLFGGFGFDSAGVCAELNDLWQFDPSTLQWTWMGGSSAPPYFQPGVYGTLGKFAPANTPGSRDSGVSWTDKNGNLWLFGGVGFDSAGTYGYFNDLWEFDPSTHEWAWMAGSNVLNQIGAYGILHEPHAGNTPGGRWGAVSWTDQSGNLWLFGGDGYDATGLNGFFNDLWEFNTTTKEWTWVGGSHLVNHGGVYGELGVPSTKNIPGSREGDVVWVDKDLKFWLFGGVGITQAGSPGGNLNDLWEFDPSTLEWTWFAGDNSLGTFFNPSGYGQSGVYGVLGVPEPGNVPGSRADASTWTDEDGNLWMFGGGGFDSAGNVGSLNDLWEFVPSTRMWAWMGGKNTAPSYGVPAEGIYGQFRVPSPANIPGGRTPAAHWTDRQGNLWLFGGSGFDALGNNNLLNDLWKYQIP